MFVCAVDAVFRTKVSLVVIGSRGWFGGGGRVRMREEDDAEDVEQCCHCTHFRTQVRFLLRNWMFYRGSDAAWSERGTDSSSLQH